MKSSILSNLTLYLLLSHVVVTYSWTSITAWPWLFLPYLFYLDNQRNGGRYFFVLSFSGEKFQLVLWGQWIYFCYIFSNFWKWAGTHSTNVSIGRYRTSCTLGVAAPQKCLAPLFAASISHQHNITIFGYSYTL